MNVQLDWIEQQAPMYAPEDLAAIDESLEYFPEWLTGRAAVIRASLLKHRAMLLGQCGAGVPIPSDIRFKESYEAYKLDIAGRPAQYHAWAISDSHMEMTGGSGATPAQARARAVVGLMLEINATAQGGGFMSGSITFKIDIPFDMGLFRHLAACAHALAAEREAELERFAISGAMPRDLGIVVSPFIAITHGAPMAHTFQQPWRVN